MTEAEALARLENMTQSDVEPSLSAPEVADLLDQAKRADSEDRAISDAEWVPTWDLNAAAAEGWRWKAGKVAGRFSVTLDGASLQRAQIYAHCLGMADRYARKIVGVLGVQTTHAPLVTEELL